MVGIRLTGFAGMVSKKDAERTKKIGGIAEVKKKPKKAARERKDK